MMKVVVIVLACLISMKGVAQLDQQKMQYLKKIEKSRRVRNFGLVMVIAGATMGIVGATKIINTPSYQQPSDKDVILWMAGAPLFSTGIPLSIVGHNTMKKYEKRLEGNLSFNFIVAPNQQGLALTYKFK